MADLTDDEILARADAIRSAQQAEQRRREDSATSAVADFVASDVFKAAMAAGEEALKATGDLARRHTELQHFVDMAERMAGRYVRANG